MKNYDAFTMGSPHIPVVAVVYTVVHFLTMRVVQGHSSSPLYVALGGAPDDRWSRPALNPGPW